MSGDFEPADDVFEKRKHERGAASYEHAKEKRKALSGRGCVFVIVLFVLFFCALGAAGWAFITPMFTDVGDRANTFMLALRDRDYQAAYALGTADFQQDVAHPENLTVLVQHPRDWHFSSFNITNSYGTVQGSIQLDDGSTRYLTVFLHHEGDGWKISGVNF